MFEKHKSNKPEPAKAEPRQDNFAASPNAPVSSGRSAVIGPGIHINGDISGDENLVIEGRVDGKVRLGNHQVDIGQSGLVNADITAKVIKIAGEVRGDMKGTEKVVISQTGNVHGNIVAPRMTLEDGAIFKGSIDMDPGEPAQPKASKPPKKAVENKAGSTAEPTKVVSGGKAKEDIKYSLNGG